MQEFDNAPDLTIDLNRSAGAEVVTGNHSGCSNPVDCTAGY
jgi:hypothetical protein